MASASTSASVNNDSNYQADEMSISESRTLVHGSTTADIDIESTRTNSMRDEQEDETHHNRAHSLGAISMSSLSSSDHTGNRDLLGLPERSRDLMEADDDSYQSLFPLSKRPWSEIPAMESSDVALPSSGLMVEANCVVDVVQAEREVRIAEQRLARCRVKESILKARLYKIQDAKARRLVQISSTQVGRAQAEVQEASRYHMRPQILPHFHGGALRV